MEMLYTKKDNNWTEFSWGDTCSSGLSIGLSVYGRKFSPNEIVSWKWAILSTTEEIDHVVVEYDLDTKYRYALEVFRLGDNHPIREFYPSNKSFSTTSGVARRVQLTKDVPVEVDVNQIKIGSTLGPGTYNLRVRFGGTGFDFHCVSNEIEIEVQ